MRLALVYVLIILAPLPAVAPNGTERG
jgi:hypothetical protein